MTFGLDDRNWRLVEKILVQPLKERHVRLWIFGSRARGDHKKFSDLDVLIQPSAPAALLSKIVEDLEESKLPIKIDIVDINDLADQYRENVMRERVEI